jgi:uncharacterized protein YeaO (DUF488 family)
MGAVEIQRVYDARSRAKSGSRARYLVDRVWPRGVRRDELDLDGWPREIAPSTELRRWFGHRPERFAEFRTKYRAELDVRRDVVDHLLTAARRGPITLLYAARDTEHNQAVVLRDYLLDLLERSRGDSTSAR